MKDDYILTPSGLIGIKKHGQMKIVVPIVLASENPEGMPR